MSNTTVIEIDAAPRGCGEVKEGSTYGGGITSISGTLQPWVWLLGKPIITYTGYGTMMWEDVPTRRPIAINPRLTLYEDEMWLVSWPDTTEGDRHLLRPGNRFTASLGMADYVGAKHYTPYSFADETAKRGPSRNWGPQVAKEWAQLTPFPVFFATKFPVFESVAIADALLDFYEIEGYEYTDDKWLDDIDGLNPSGTKDDWIPTWHNPNFSLERDDVNAPRPYVGADHPMARILYILNRMHNEEIPQAPAGLMPFDYQTAIFGASWITCFFYVVGDEGEEIPEELAEAGVVAGIKRVSEKETYQNEALSAAQDEVLNKVLNEVQGEVQEESA